MQPAQAKLELRTCLGAAGRRKRKLAELRTVVVMAFTRRGQRDCRSDE
jgi:hypothetical protein